MPRCAICGESNAGKWTVITEIEGCDSTPYESNLAHVTCKYQWVKEQSNLNESESSPGTCSGDVTDIDSRGMWFTR